MKKSLWYILILMGITTYFYVGYCVSSHWEAAVKYGSKVTHNTLGKQIPLLNLKDTRKDDFYVIIDSLKNRKYFRVIGITSDSLLFVNYGKDASVLPQVLDYSSYITSPGLFIDKRISWVDEVIKNEENFNDKLDYLNIGHIDSLLATHIVIGYGLDEDRPLSWFEIITDYYTGNPILLAILILALLCALFVFESLVNIFFSGKKEIVKRIAVLTVILLYAYAQSNYVMDLSQFTVGWFGSIIVTFVSHSLVYFVFQYINQRLITNEFEKKECIKFLTIIFLGVIFQVLFRVMLFGILDESVLRGYELNIVFYNTLQQAFKFWIAIATANFLHNLIRYFYTLRRKAKQLQTVTSDALISADALQQSEAHVNTHFLYNSLHAIAALATIALDKTEILALSLAKYYRYTTNRNDETWIAIKEEVEALTAYLEVEKIRMGEKLSYDFDIKDDDLSVKIVKFLLQPLVENAIKYGYNTESDSTKIKIVVIKNDNDTLKISVCDSGKPFSEAMEIGTGIRNVKDMLKRFYPDSHMISFVNGPVKCVEILLNIKNITK